MISLLAFSKIKTEIQYIKKNTVSIGAYLSEDQWRVYGFLDIEGVKEFLNKKSLIDISCVDVTEKNGVAVAEQIRKSNGDVFMILIADSSVSPVTYIKPTIMASSLLLRPISEDALRDVLKDVMGEYLKKFCRDKAGENFVIDNRDGRQLIPYDRIVYFESRDKKIFLNVGGEEYSFYDTLDHIEEELSTDFIRCHRSFIVAKSYIKKILLSQNLVLLKNDYQIPLSRTYKSVFKELK